MSEARIRFGSGTAVVTGGAAGIGEGFVLYLAQLGMTVVVADIDSGRAARVADGINAAGGSASSYGIDVTDAAAVEDMQVSKRLDFSGKLTSIGGSASWTSMSTVSSTVSVPLCQKCWRSVHPHASPICRLSAD